jgi:hypothetical protein
VPFQDVGAWEKVLEAYSDVLAVLLASADVERRRAEEIERFNREVRPGLIADLLGDPVQIALLLDLPALAQEGEETADTMTRMVVALDGIGQAMDMLGVRAAQLRGDLDIPAQLVERLAEIDKAIDIANVAPVTTQDPAKMNAAIQDLITLEEQRLALILETTAALRSQMQAQAASLSSGFVALAQAAPVLNDLGIAVYNMTYALGDVINILGEVGDAAGQLATVGSQVAAFAAEISGADPAVILGSARALAAGLSATAASVNALEDAQQRMAGLTQLLGALTTGYQEATAALAAHFAELQAQEEALHASRIDALQSEVDAATRIVEAYYGSQRDALTALLATSRQFSESARRVRDQILGIQLAPTTSALNPADRLDVALTELGAAFAKFQATPTAELADRVGERVGQALTAAGEVFSRPSPAFAALSGDMISILETVAATAEARVVPEEASRILLASIDASETAALIELGAINSATAATEAYLKGTLTKENLDRLQDLGIISLAQKEIATALGSPLTVETGLKEILSGLGLSPETEQSLNAIAGVVAAGSSAAQAIKDLNTDHAAKLDAIAEAEAAWGAVLNLELANIAGQIVGTTAEVLDVATEVGVVNSTLWHISTQTNGIWGAANALLTELVTTRADLVRVIGTAPVDQFMRDRAKETADSLQNLRESIHGSLWLLVSGRLDAILDQGGPQAVADALKGPAEQTARNTSLIAANIYWMTHALRGGIGLEQVALPQAATGMWDVPRDQAVFVHRGEMIKPAAAAEWERRGGLSVQTASGSRTETERSVNITLNISGADDPRRVGDEVIRRLRRELGLYGKTL